MRRWMFRLSIVNWWIFRSLVKKWRCFPYGGVYTTGAKKEILILLHWSNQWATPPFTCILYRHLTGLCRGPGSVQYKSTIRRAENVGTQPLPLYFASCLQEWWCICVAAWSWGASLWLRPLRREELSHLKVQLLNGLPSYAPSGHHHERCLL